MLQIIQHSGITFGLYSGLFDMIFSLEGVVSSQDYEYQIKAICKMVSNRSHAFGAAGMGIERSPYIYLLLTYRIDY